jgi:hypothetical protein
MHVFVWVFENNLTVTFAGFFSAIFFGLYEMTGSVSQPCGRVETLKPDTKD